MKILHGPALITELRARADNIKERLWIAVPYIGSLTSVRKLLGKSWFNTPTVPYVLSPISEIWKHLIRKRWPYFINGALSGR